MTNTEQKGLDGAGRTQIKFMYPDGDPAVPILREKQGDFSEAIRLCEEAKKAGWGLGVTSGPADWDTRIARLRKKLAK